MGLFRNKREPEQAKLAELPNIMGPSKTDFALLKQLTMERKEAERKRAVLVKNQGQTVTKDNTKKNDDAIVKKSNKVFIRSQFPALPFKNCKS